MTYYDPMAKQIKRKSKWCWNGHIVRIKILKQDKWLHASTEVKSSHKHQMMMDIATNCRPIIAQKERRESSSIPVDLTWIGLNVNSPLM